MKKNKTKDQEQKRKSRRLSLNRETILVLNDPALLELARGEWCPTGSITIHTAGCGSDESC